MKRHRVLQSLYSLFALLSLLATLSAQRNPQWRTTLEGNLPKAYRFTATVESVVGDIDGDGDMDVFIVDDHGTRDYLFRNDGVGSFEDITATHLYKSSFRDSVGAAMVDVDGDGDLDIVHGGAHSGKLFLYRNNGKGKFTNVSTVAFPFRATYVVGLKVGDFDGDNDVDLLFLGSQRPHQLLLNNGKGVFADVTKTNLPPKSDKFGSGVAVWDLEQDGDLDFSFLGGRVTLLNDGKAKFTIAKTSPLPTPLGYRIIPGDVDRDGLTDLLIDGYRLVRGLGQGRYQEVTKTAMPGPAGGLAVFADVDVDGDLDIVSSVDVLLNDGKGRFVAAKARAALSKYMRIGGIADFDGDRDLDLLILSTGQSANNMSRVYFNHLRQVASATQPKIGSVHRVDLFVRPGFNPVFHMALPMFGIKKARIPIPPLGYFRIDPGMLLVGSWLLVPTGSGTVSWSYGIPKQSSLKGLTLYHQALIVDLQLPSVLSNLDRVTIQ